MSNDERNNIGPSVRFSVVAAISGGKRYCPVPSTSFLCIGTDFRVR